MNIQKKLLSFMLIFTLSCSLCACQKQDTKSKVSNNAALPELRIGVDILKPFFYKDANGNYAGIDADIAKEACHRAGYKPHFVEISWSNRDNYLESGNVDCLWSAFIKDGREDSYLWTDTYLQSNLRAIVDKHTPDQKLETSTAHGGMAVRAGSKIEEMLLNKSSDHDPIHIYSCGTFTMAETAFVKGYVNALGGHEAVLQQIIKDYPGTYRFLDGTIMTADLGVAFRKDDTSGHCEKINTALQSMIKDGTITDISQKYIPASSTDKEVSENAEN